MKKTFEINDVVFYRKDEEKASPYVIIGVPSTSLIKQNSEWKEVYIYSGNDKKTGKIKNFVRLKEDFEINFHK